MNVWRIFYRLKRRVGPDGRERGAALVEFALVLPILIALTFGIVEFSSVYHDSSVTADAAVPAAGWGSAQATSVDYASSIVASVDSALSTLPRRVPQELWIYKANSKGYPGSGDDFSSCASNCIKYRWDESTRSFDTSNPQGGGWSASSQQVCRQPFDELGVFVKINHAFVTRLFGADITLTDHAVFRFEPVPTSVCAP